MSIRLYMSMVINVMLAWISTRHLIMVDEGREQLIDHTNVNDRLIDNQQPQSSSALSAVFEVF